MFQDVCFPKNNEKEFIDMAIKLGTDALIFVYEFKDNKDLDEKRRKILEIKNIKADLGILVNEKTVEKLQNFDDYVFSKTPIKSLIEHKKTYILYDFELQEKSDFLHHRNAGLNQVFCAIMNEKEKILGVSFSTLLNAYNKSVILGRMKQNVMLAKKYKVKIHVLSFAKKPYELRATHELNAFGKILGV